MREQPDLTGELQAPARAQGREAPRSPYRTQEHGAQQQAHHGHREQLDHALQRERHGQSRGVVRFGAGHVGGAHGGRTVRREAVAYARDHAGQ